MEGPLFSCTERARVKVALYLHFPYCRSRCTYCDFNAYTDAGESARADYIEALCQDIRQTGRERRYRVQTVFCGGGTPSLHTAEELGRVLQSCREAFDFQPREVTLEANPGTVTLEQLCGLRQAGFNRLSYGVQSFQSELLKRLNRIHSADEVEQGMHWARQAGFTNVSLDLIFGLPGQQRSDWRQTLERALALHPEHLSVYQLTVEKGTHLEAQVRRGEVTLPDEDITWGMDLWLRRRLRAAGLRRYEVSNWSKPGFEAQHNLVYWRDEPYLGLGCGATGFVGGWRVRRLLHPHAYQQALAHGASPVIHAERRDQEGALRDCLMMGLRTRAGVQLAALFRRFPHLTKEALESFLQSLPANWWSLSARRLRLTSHGVDFVSSVCEKMMDYLLLEPPEGAPAHEDGAVAEQRGLFLSEVAASLTA
jgi:oxygen-independent coproporphyrinogen III oxidase